jgi:uncharacterized transporter YbjL
MFLYGIGMQYGKHFFAGISGVSGRHYNFLAVVALASLAQINTIWFRLGPVIRRRRG